MPLRLRRTVVTLSATAVAAALLFLPSCQTRNCEGILEIYGNKPGQGGFVDSDTWQSNGNADVWLPFPAQRTWLLIPPGVTGPGGRRLKYSLVYVSPADNPNRIPAPDQPGDNFTLGTGNVAEVTYRTDAVFVHNDTCANYYARIVLVLEPNQPAPTEDAGTDGASLDGELLDAPSDAPLDAGGDGSIDP